MTVEETVDIVTAFRVGKPDSLVIVIPSPIRQRMHIDKGARFILKLDEQGRLIYEPIEKKSDAATKPTSPQVTASAAKQKR